MEGQHVKLTIHGKVGVVKINSPNSKVNVLNEEVMAEMNEATRIVQSDTNILATVLISGKQGCFIAGADITMLEKITSVQEGIQKSKEGHSVLNQIEASKKPVVVAIQGSCLGGGLEVALACHYRIAVRDTKTSLGLPEVLLGLLPGAGGTQRLTKLVGVPASLDLMLTGRMIKAEKALQIGLIDRVVEPVEPGTEFSDERTARYLEEVAVQIANDLASPSYWSWLFMKPHRTKSVMASIMEWVLMIGYAKDKVFGKARAQVMEKSKGLYPAPLKILDVVRTGLDKGPKAGYDAEAIAFGELVQTPESQGLISLFQGRTECKKNRFGRPERPFKNLAVLGAGAMGVGIVQVSAEKGFKVIMKSATEKGLARGSDKIYKGFEAAKNRNRITAEEQDKIISNISFQLDYKDFDQIDVVIEAAYEDINVKHRIIKEVEGNIPEHCILAICTSALRIAKIAEVSQRPDKIIGMHYFSPVDKMQLVEIITTPQTSKDTIAAAIHVGLQQDKAVLVVQDGPGFYTSRILGFMVAEMFCLIQEGVDPKKLDKLTTSFGFPVGICTVVDEIGLDVILHVGKELVGAFGPRFSENTDAFTSFFEDMLTANYLGRKSGKGIFVYDAGTRGHPVNPEHVSILASYKLDAKLPLEDEDILMRMVTRFVNEAVLCLEKEIIASPLEGDVGAVFGLGFSPFTGGPFHYVDSYGAQNLVDKMKKYELAYGSCFAPCQLLLDHASDPTKKFFPKK